MMVLMMTPMEDGAKYSDCCSYCTSSQAMMSCHYFITAMLRSFANIVAVTAVETIMTATDGDKEVFSYRPR